MDAPDNNLPYYTIVDMYYLQRDDPIFRQAFLDLWEISKYTDEGLEVAILDDNAELFEEIFNVFPGTPGRISELLYGNKPVEVLDWIIDALRKPETPSISKEHLRAILDDFTEFIDEAIIDQQWEQIRFLEENQATRDWLNERIREVESVALS